VRRGIRSRAGRRGRWRFWGLALAVVLAGVVGAALVAVVTRGNSSRRVARPRHRLPRGVCSATDVANKTLPTVVTISAGNGPSGGTGSGEIIRGEGYILTNNHVISVAANGGQVSVLFSDGHSPPATITGRDPQADLAVIRVDGQPSLPVIPFGSSKDVVVASPS
jgi:putative serine protease PepD